MVYIGVPLHDAAWVGRLELSDNLRHLFDLLAGFVRAGY